MDLSKTQAEWDRFLGREFASMILAPAREARESYDKFTRERVQIVPLNLNGNITALTLTGVDAGNNTSKAGELWARFTANGGDWDVSLYKAAGAGGGDEVASVTALADGGTSALTEENGSGLGGSITLGAAVVAVANDLYKLLVVVDYPARLPKVWTQVDAIEEDKLSREIATALYAELAALDLAKIDACRRAATRFMLRSPSPPGSNGPNLLARGNVFNRVNETSLSAEVETVDGSGNVTRRRSGIFPTITKNMEDETDGGEQDVVRRVVAASAGAFDAANDGLGTVASTTPMEKCPIGEWRFECEAGANTVNLGSESFRWTFVATDGSGISLSGSGLRVGRDDTPPRGMSTLRLRRTYSKTGDGSNLNLAAVTTGLFSGETNANTDSGVLYWKIVANGSNWDVEFYKDSSRTALVAKATNVATGAALQATAQNASGLTVTWTVGSAPVATTTGTVDCNAFQTKNSSNVPDKFRVTTSITGTPGLIQTILAEEFDAQLNSDASGSETIQDDWAKQGTFAPFLAFSN